LNKNINNKKRLKMVQLDEEKMVYEKNNNAKSASFEDKKTK
jgi:hypothetical protein